MGAGVELAGVDDLQTLEEWHRMRKCALAAFSGGFGGRFSSAGLWRWRLSPPGFVVVFARAALLAAALLFVVFAAPAALVFFFAAAFFFIAGAFAFALADLLFAASFFFTAGAFALALAALLFADAGLPGVAAADFFFNAEAFPLVCVRVFCATAFGGAFFRR